MINILYIGLATLSLISTNKSTGVTNYAPDYSLSVSHENGNSTEYLVGFNSIGSGINFTFNDIFGLEDIGFALTTENQFTNLFTMSYDDTYENLVFTTNTDYLINQTMYVKLSMDLNPGTFQGQVYIPLWNDNTNEYTISMNDVPLGRTFNIYFYFYEIPEEFITFFNGNPDSPSYYQGYNQGFDDATNNWQNSGLIYNEQDLQIYYNDGYLEGREVGYQEGYTAASEELNEQNTTASLIFTGILSVGLLPVNVFLQILNFEVFGINIAGFISGLLSVCIIVIIFRVILGGKSDKNG